MNVACWSAILICLCLFGPVIAGDESEGDLFFESRIRPVLVERCTKCHGSKKASNGLRVDSLDALKRGGERGPAVVAGDPEQSLLVRAIRRIDEDLQMPPDKALPQSVVGDFVKWIRAGATWPESRDDEPVDIGTHWALKPIGPVQPPTTQSSWASSSPIDPFVAMKLEENALNWSPETDKRTLLRRAFFDLIGLPPTPEDLSDFVADESPDVFSRVVDRLLASPGYGERWGRHWLDVVRYADTAGETADFPVPDAYRYRNYVIDSFNADKPYDRFVREQIAGDLLAKAGLRENYAEQVIATGYLAVGRRFGWDRRSEYHVTMGECIDTIGQSLLGLTLGCARCHDHKYDPVSTEDYYALYGILASTTFSYPGSEADKKPENTVVLVSEEEANRILASHKAKTDGPETELRRLDDEYLRLKGELAAVKQIPKGTPLLEVEEGELFVRGSNYTLATVSDINQGDVSVAVDARSNAEGGILLRYRDARNFLLANYRSGGPEIYFHEMVNGNYGAMLSRVKAEGLAATFRLVATVQGDEVELVASDGEYNYTTSIQISTVKWSGTVGLFHHATQEQAFDNFAVFEDGRKLFDDSFDDRSATRSRWRLSQGEWKPDPKPGEVLTAKERKKRVQATEAELEKLEKPRAEVRKQLAELATQKPPLPSAYAVAEGKPQNVRIHERGNPKKLGNEVPRGFLEILGGDRVPDGSGSGRLELANWLTRPENPLTPRVMANRIWQQHFGKGIVGTPNNFGFRGEPPTHPALLDYLAWRFSESGWSIKSAQRLVMLSRTYRSSSVSQPDAARVDPDNRFLWRYTRRRLDAESIRDAMLDVSGDLVRGQGGAFSFPPAHTWQFSQHGPFRPNHADYETDRRSVYLMIQRNKRNPYLELFDSADPRTTTPQRFISTTPAQALYFMNHPFILQRAKGLAARVLGERRAEHDRINRAYQLTFGRPPESDELTEAMDYLSAYRRRLVDQGVSQADATRKSWVSHARILLSTNEFNYVE